MTACLSNAVNKMWGDWARVRKPEGQIRQGGGMLY